MRALAGLLLLAIAVAGCTSSPPPSGGNTTGQGSNLYGEGNATSGANPAITQPGTGNGSLTWHNAQNPVVVWTTTMGTFKAELFLDKAPITAGNFLNLTRQGFYDGTRFHRVIRDFMIQDGDPNTKDPALASRWGTGSPGYSIKDEFPCKDGTTSYAHFRSTGQMPCGGKAGMLFTHDGPGLLSMANGGPNTGGSQYFVTVTATPHLDGQHAIFGRVVAGYDVVDAISKVPTTRDRPNTDVVIQSLRVEGS